MVFRGNRVHRLDALQRFETDFGFKLRMMLTTFLRHVDRSFLGLDLTIPPVQFSGSTSVHAQCASASSVFPSLLR